MSKEKAEVQRVQNVLIGMFQISTCSPSPDIEIQKLDTRLTDSLGIEACIIASKPEGKSKYYLSLRWTLASNVLRCRMEGSWACWWHLVRFPSLQWQSVVPKDSEIITACEIGNVEMMVDLFSSGRASPNDVTPDNLTLLYYAIFSGNPHAVQLLLDMGCDSNLSYGRWNTSPLNHAFFYGNGAIVRRLLEAKADLDYVNQRMWTSAGYLYDQELCNRHTIELLDICACEEFDQWNSLDAVGWTVLHKAAAFGRAKDIKRLMNLGASTQVHNYNMRWQPIHCAVFHGNENTFDILADAIPAKHLAQLTDAQGWTLLHLAAEHGSEAMMTNLLKRGLDSLFMSNQSSLRVPAGLENREITPRDIARACGHEQAFDRALRAAVDA